MKSVLLSIFLMPVFTFAQTDTIITKPDFDGKQLNLLFEAGEEHNHPLMAVWVEDENSDYLETLFVAKSIATSVFGHGDASGGVWKPGVVRRPAALPYWSHKRGIQAEDGYYLPTPGNPVPDAISGPTPQEDFVLRTRLPVNGRIRVLLEINQSWDWNEYWTNTKFPGDEQYRTSSQPSIIYEALINLSDPEKSYEMKAIGHGHYSGKDGKLYKDLSTLTSAKEIVKHIKVVIE
ncbi:MAG: hypothetical protein K9G67_13200 [Bacteroidales bacterium]|nr:hypothetical protein [Bacteroidales bacterium]MCF8344748.1 hypothetical protein [Bacteroidales bacterium]MCF8352105.1 hypothetical protein [Bacteroidales bacterium]MCF8377307.1 hypothetical protein [Bacteroidales bacterium]MCF8401389.1 hypothetical protein [Bacteroidales bacterium]